MTEELIGLTDQRRLEMLFDSAAACQCDVSIYDINEPEAATVLALWASTRHLPFESRAVRGADRVLSVATSERRSICVYLFQRAA
jgi:hypothetical protein